MSRRTTTTVAAKSASATTKSANSGATSVKPKKSRPKKRSASTAKRKPHVAKAASLKSNPLPPAIDVPLPSYDPSQAALDPNKLHLLDPSPTTQSQTRSDGGIETSSDPLNEPMSPEAERLLNGIPDVIGDVPVEGIGGQAAPPASDDPIAGLMAAIAFEEEDVRDTLTESFEWLAERFKSDHWKLTERQARMLGKPTAMLLNSLWSKLQTILPDILAKWCEETPGATAFILACGIVVVPKVAQQVSISRAKGKATAQARMTRPSNANGPARPPQPRPVVRDASNMIHTAGE